MGLAALEKATPIRVARTTVPLGSDARGRLFSSVRAKAVRKEFRARTTRSREAQMPVVDRHRLLSETCRHLFDGTPLSAVPTFASRSKNATATPCSEHLGTYSRQMRSSRS